MKENEIKVLVNKQCPLAFCNINLKKSEVTASLEPQLNM